MATSSARPTRGWRVALSCQDVHVGPVPAQAGDCAGHEVDQGAGDRAVLAEPFQSAVLLGPWPSWQRWPPRSAPERKSATGLSAPTDSSQRTVLSAKSNSTPDPLTAAAIRTLEWVHGSIIGAIFSLVPALLLGVRAARRRILDEPERHRHVLQRIAVLGVGLAAVGGLPWALVRTSWWKPPSDAVARANDSGGAAQPFRIWRPCRVARDSNTESKDPRTVVVVVRG